MPEFTVDIKTVIFLFLFNNKRGIFERIIIKEKSRQYFAPINKDFADKYNNKSIY